MKASANRILTTHVGSMPRPKDIQDMLRAKQDGQPFDQALFAKRVRESVAEAVKGQADNGIDVIADGEISKASFLGYAHARLAGFSVLSPAEAVNSPSLQTRRWSRHLFPEYYAEYDRLPPGRPPQQQVACTSPVSYKGQNEVKFDIDNMNAALKGVRHEDVFMPAVSPGTVGRGLNQHYKTDEEFRFALADALHEEYKAITDAGFILQIDDPGLGETWDMYSPPISLAEYRKLSQMRINALNHALRGIPEEMVRYHICWGSWQGPHTNDIPLQDVVDIMLSVKAQAYSVEAANPIHEWEWQVWQKTKLPDGKILIPGVIAHTTAVVEHPETVAMRLNNFAQVVGRERVIGGIDCGFAQGAFIQRQHPTIMYAKFKALSEGAKLLSSSLWRK